MEENKELTEYIKNLLQINPNSILNDIQATKCFTFEIFVFYNSLRWNSQYQFYRKNLDIDISFSNSGQSKYSYKNDDFTKFMNGGSIIKKTSILNTHSLETTNLTEETGVQTGVFKKFIPLLSDSVPNLFKELIFDNNNDISKFNWSKFNYDELEKDLEKFCEYRTIFYENNSEQEEYNQVIQFRNNLLEQEIELKIKPRGQFQDLNYGYEIINEKKDFINYKYAIVELFYNENFYYLLLDETNDVYKLNKPLKEQKKSIFASLFK